VTINIETDFSGVNWSCLAQIIRTSTALTVTNLKRVNVRLGGQAAGTALLECYDDTATTAVQEDPGNYFFAGFGDI
jgi:hypothetical protein